MQLGHTIKFRSCLQQAFVVGDLETDRPILPLAPTQFNPCSSGSVISMQIADISGDACHQMALHTYANWT